MIRNNKINPFKFKLKYCYYNLDKNSLKLIFRQIK